MDRYRHLRITGTKASLRQLIDTLVIRTAGGWRRSLPREQSINAVTDLYCFECQAAPGRPSATVWVSLKDDGQVLYDTALVPIAREVLSIAECNTILESFVEEMIQPLVTDSGLFVEFSSSTFDLADHMSTIVRQALQGFSSNANRATRSAHPSDEARWFTFIIAAHLEKSDLTPKQLNDWLLHDGWDVDSASDLAIEYETARNLLNAYDSVSG